MNRIHIVACGIKATHCTESEAKVNHPLVANALNTLYNLMDHGFIENVYVDFTPTDKGKHRSNEIRQRKQWLGDTKAKDG